MNLVWQAEDSLREKKLQNDLGDLLKTMVAFANSVAPHDVATILIGEKDDGTVQGVTNVESIQRSVAKEAEKIYPEIYYKTEVYERDGKNCVRVDIKRNGLAPHFGGAGWVRQGSKSVPATRELYQQLIDLRSSKVRSLTEWKGKVVTLSYANVAHSVPGPNWGAFPCELIEVTGFFSTFKKKDSEQRQSEPNDWLTLGWDDQESRLHVYVAANMKSRPPNGW
jgi:hypothetical protein